MISSDSLCGTDGFTSCGSSGCDSATARSSAVSVLPSNAAFPVAARYSTQPSENRSLRASTGSPLTCSGDMYAGVPTTAPGRVRPSTPVC